MSLRMYSWAMTFVLTILAFAVFSGKLPGISFAAAAQSPTFTVDGRITNSPPVTGTPIPGVAVKLVMDGGAQMNTQTDSAGNFSFSNVSGNYDVTPSKVGYVFNPVSRGGNGPQTLYFTGTFDNSSAVQFSGPSYSVAEQSSAPTESDRAVFISVVRTGDLSGTLSLNYATSDGTATQRTDYTTTSGTLTFRPNEPSKNFPVLIIDNAYVDGTRTVNLTLSGAVGGTVGNQNTAVLNITNNDTSPPTTNPIDDATFFVRQHYYDFLSRIPDDGGLGYWSSNISSCRTDANCINSRRVGVSAAYFIELEFQDTGGFVYRFYKSSYGVRPTYVQFMPDRSRVVAGANLDAGKASFAEQWVQRPEFIQKYPLSQSGTEFITALLQTVHDGSNVDIPSQPLIDDYNINHSRARIVQMVAENADFKTAEYNRAFVLMQYFGYLRRDPEQGGYDFWLNLLNTDQRNNFRGMVCAFIMSSEYQTRFSSIVTRNDQLCAAAAQ